MCWILLALGSVMLAVGVFFLLRFFVGHGENSPLVATVNRTESMILGVALMSIGFLLFVLGLTQSICLRFGLA